jgi:hypothetical protein
VDNPTSGAQVLAAPMSGNVWPGLDMGSQSQATLLSSEQACEKKSLRSRNLARGLAATAGADSELYSNHSAQEASRKVYKLAVHAAPPRGGRKVSGAIAVVAEV